jgi:hypothetical protein
MLARWEGCDPIEAMCLGKGSKKGKWTSESMTCEAWASNHLGQIDDPHYGEEVHAAYEAETNGEAALKNTP